MPESQKKKLQLDKDTVETIECVIDEVGCTTKTVFEKIADLVIKKSKETINSILDSQTVILKEKIRSKERSNDKKNTKKETCNSTKQQPD